MAGSVAWGEWMGAWKAEEGCVDDEQERLNRQQAAFGGETLARMKDINVLILGCRGVGVEAAKNLILSNVGSVTVWDPEAATVEDRGANFYLTEESVGKPRAAECLPQLKSLNPYCKVEALGSPVGELVTIAAEPNVLSTGRGYSVIVVADHLPKETLIALNSQARAVGAAFLMAVNMGVTASLFSDFGKMHVIADEDGEPTQMLAISNAEILPAGGIVKVEGTKEGDKLLVITLASNYDNSLQDGDSISLDDMRGELAGYTGKVLKVRRFHIMSPADAKVDLNDTGTKEMLKLSTAEVIINFGKQHDFYSAEFAASGKEGKMKERELNLFNRLCIQLEEGADLEQWGAYKSGGLVNTVKTPIMKEYEMFEKTLTFTAMPQMLDQEAWCAGQGCWVQLALAAAFQFQADKGRWPELGNSGDADELVQAVKSISETNKALEGACWLQKVEWGFPSGEPADFAEIEPKLRRFSLLFRAELTGLCAYLGGAVAQEVIKKTGKFLPIEQWLHHDDSDMASGDGQVGDFAGTRYSHQAAVFGPQVVKDISVQRVFLVGCGALGCEYLKGLSLMGACTAPEAKLIVTDMDRIEVTNLSRQFLFRQSDVGNPKSTSAARVVKGWNPDLKIEALEKGVGVTSEDFFDDEFWGSLDLCWNALDNVVARKYTDRCCLWYGLPLLESGTLGTKSNSDVFLPGHTKSYNDGTESDANETQIAMCTLRSFPYLPIHCIEFAKQAYFVDYFEFAPQQYESFRKDKAGFFEQLDAMGESEQLKALKMIKGFIELQKAGQVDFAACIRVAFRHYCADFITSVRDLVHNCDKIEESTGKPFWTGTKRRPIEAKWDKSDPTAEANEYLYAAANCYAFIWKLPYVRGRAAFRQQVVDLGLEVPAWSLPGEDAKVDEGEEEGDAVDPAAIEALKGDLYSVDTDGLQQCEAHDFEKDDDANFHIDFMTIGANLRAANYDIKAVERSHVKVTAGRIIPALATTTAMICGLVDLEFVKLARGLHKQEGPLDRFFNANINLATGLQAMNVFRPEPAIKKETKLSNLTEFTSWDKVELQGEMTLKALIEEVQTRHSAVVKRLFPAGDDKICIYDSTQVEKLGWKIEITDGDAVIEPEAVYGAWPQLRFAKQMLSKSKEGPARKNFEAQINAAAKSLQALKDGFEERFNGPASEAYTAAARPSDEHPEKQTYFDTVQRKRKYIAMQAHVCNESGEEGDLPEIRYTFRQ